MNKVSCASCGCSMYPAPREPANLCSQCWLDFKYRQQKQAEDWGDVTKMPGYWEPDIWVVQ